MRPDPSLIGWRRQPTAWMASPRRRRLVFVALAAPGGVMAIAGAQILVCPPLLVAGAAWLAAAVAARAASEPRFRAREAKDPPSPSDRAQEECVS